MSNSSITMMIFFGILIGLSFLALAYILIQNKKSAVAQLKQERDLLKMQFDQARKEKIDLEDEINSARAQEKTYKVAYEDWKSKYALLEEKYFQLKKEFQEIAENKPPSNHSHDPINNTQATSSPQASVHVSGHTLDGQKILQDLKTILDQHLEIISRMIGEEDFQKMSKPPVPSDPLHWIQGMNEEVIQKLHKQGVRSFDQIAAASRRDVGKWIMEFEDIDERIIESWPLQAAAIKASTGV